MRRVCSVLWVIFLLVMQTGLALAVTPSDTYLQQPVQRDKGVIIEEHRVSVEIDNQVAVTRIEQVFFNDSSFVAEGTYVFPLPMGAAVSDLVMWVDGRPVEAKILDADEARRIYDEIVRRQRDPALLEYVGAGAIQASVFPIQPYSEVKIEIEYGQLLPVEEGLVHYVYPLRTDHLSRHPVERLSIHVGVRSNDPISTVYSPTHRIAISRDGDYAFRVGYEDSYVRPESDFSLYYGLASEEINANLLTYRESAREDGFFTLMITPPLQADADRIVPKDVIIVLDQSGSMHGEKWDQARKAVEFVLENLNRRDRFNVIVFSTGYRVFADDLQPASVADEAIDWVQGLEALGGTDIDGALSEAMRMADRERSTVVLFLTDGLPTEGETDAARILAHVEKLAPPNVRIFTFGVGDDVDTFLLDQLWQRFRGAGTYVRPGERVDDEVSSLYSKISAPVLTNLELDVEGVLVEELFPERPLPDLFAGTQLIIVGRYRDGGPATIRLQGDLDGQRKVYTYEVEFRERAGGEAFIARLWATRKIGALLNAIRLHGEDPELVDSVIRLSIRYGIITPYTSFLITEDDIFTQEGREEVQMRFEAEAGAAFAAPSGAAAVDAAEAAAGLSGANAPLITPAPMPTMVAPGEEAKFATGEQVIRYVGDRTFVWRDGVWVDTLYDADRMTPQRVIFLSDEYFALLDRDPQIGEFLALGERVLFVWEGQAYEMVSA